MVARFGIASFAHYHANSWAEVANASPKADLVGIWDADEARGRDAAQRFGTTFFPHLEELARECDGVGVTSATAHHADIIEIIAAEGCAILCEKPLAVSLAEAARIVHAVEASGVTFVMNFPKRFDPATAELRRILRSGDIGLPVYARVRHGHGHGAESGFQSAWFQDPALSGGGTLLDEGIHAVDLLHYLFGPPANVVAAISSRALGLAVEDTASATFAFESGLLADVTTSWCMQFADSSVEIFATKGTITLAGVDLASKGSASPPFLRVGLQGEGAWTPVDLTPAFMTPEFHQQGPRHFFDVIAGAAPLVTLDDGVRSLASVLAAYAAAETGERRQLDC